MLPNISPEKRKCYPKKINDAKNRQPREIQLSCLKNHKVNNYDCYFRYFSARDYFSPCTDTDFIISNSDKKISRSDDNAVII